MFDVLTECFDIDTDNDDEHTEIAYNLKDRHHAIYNGEKFDYIQIQTDGRVQLIDTEMEQLSNVTRDDIQSIECYQLVLLNPSNT